MRPIKGVFTPLFIMRALKISIMTFCAILFSLLSIAIAEEKDQKADKTTMLQEVLVEASRMDLPLNASVHDKEDLRSGLAATSDTANLLRDVPGVSLYGAGGVSSLPVVHGLADDRVRVRVDGMDMIASCPNHMNPPLSYIDPAQIGEIQVFAGITPVSLGGDSLGGTIVVNAPDPEFAKTGEGTLLKGEINSFYRSNGNSFGGSVSATVASEKCSVTYTGTGAVSDNYYAAEEFKNTTRTGHLGHDYLPLDEVASSAYAAQNHALGYALKLQNHLIEAKMAYQNIPYENYPNQRMDMLGNTQYLPSLRYEGEFDWGKLEALAFYQFVKHHMDFGDDKQYWYGTGSPASPIGTAWAAGMPMDTRGNTTGISAKADINVSDKDILRVGNEMQFYRLDDWWPPSGRNMWPGTFWNINNGSRDRLAFFGEWEKQIIPGLMALLGGRYELVRMNTGEVTGYNPAGAGNQGRDAGLFNARDHEKFDNNWEMTALGRYTVNPALDLELGYAHKTRSPNIYERYAWSTWSMAAEMVNWFGDGNGYIGDIGLKPEQANTFSATVDLHTDDRKWELKATPYYTGITDYIDAIQWNATTNAPSGTLTGNQFVVLKFVNQSARLFGFDVAGKMPLAQTRIGDFGLKGLFSYTDGENLDTDDGLYNIMPINTTLTLTHEKGGWSGAIETVLVGNKYDVSDQRNEIKTEGYALVNLRCSYTWKQVRVDFGIENLFDRKYFLPLGGAYVGQGMTMPLNPTDGIVSWGTAVPGPARSIYTSATIEF